MQDGANTTHIANALLDFLHDTIHLWFPTNILHTMDVDISGHPIAQP
jgi:hypothetical protein